MNDESKSGVALLTFLLLAFSAAGIGGAVTAPAIRSGWYDALHKPSWTPPKGVFGPVWTLLYVMMALSAWLVWRKNGVCKAHGWWSLQLALNALWSLLFFGGRKPRLALAEIIVLWIAITATLRSFRQIDKRAGALLIPYWMWTSFAVALNGAIARQNN